MTAFILFVVGLVVCFGGGWYCKSRFGTEVKTAVDKVV